AAAASNSATGGVGVRLPRTGRRARDPAISRLTGRPRFDRQRFDRWRFPGEGARARRGYFRRRRNDPHVRPAPACWAGGEVRPSKAVSETIRICLRWTPMAIMPQGAWVAALSHGRESGAVQELHIAWGKAGVQSFPFSRSKRKSE